MTPCAVMLPAQRVGCSVPDVTEKVCGEDVTCAPGPVGYTLAAGENKISIPQHVQRISHTRAPDGTASTPSVLRTNSRVVGVSVNRIPVVSTSRREVKTGWHVTPIQTYFHDYCTLMSRNDM